MKKIFYCLFSLFYALVSCSRVAEIKNNEKGNLKATDKLVLVADKKFPLDSGSAAKPQLIQVYTDTAGRRSLVCLNTFTNSLNFYDYETLAFTKRVAYERKGPDQIMIPLGFYIKNEDSTYVYNDMQNDMVLINSKGKVLSRTSVINNMDPKKQVWTLSYPQHYPQTVTPIMELSGKLVLPGQFMWTLPDTLIHKFNFTSVMNMHDSTVQFVHNYPDSLYGFSYIWDDPLFTMVFCDAGPGKDEIIYSFPISHNLYIADISKPGYKVVYGGSNEAGTISSFEKPADGKISREALNEKACLTDLYGGIKYDKYRKVYYRFLRKALPESGRKLRWEDKEVTVIIMDEHFRYLGETSIGTMHEFYPENAFVTKEGLNIEYLDDSDVDEKFMNFKIFQPQKI
ncbi:DUF4221 family protein [Chitinophaga tropicalis]|uniref:DUF4221 domain-containing protein n=1 Tax=Chitinophaga tropicalis TaxID=2683588 RepID=A0A7K1U7M0_9BACT|nr:DUF4221 family protein [Chitinophaga tropicalis]MVT10296.1 DUF4221 domain-containing protein [Chitinophaga tropicalis]